MTLSHVMTSHQGRDAFETVLMDSKSTTTNTRAQHHSLGDDAKQKHPPQEHPCGGRFAELVTDPTVTTSSSSSSSPICHSEWVSFEEDGDSFSTPQTNTKATTIQQQSPSVVHVPMQQPDIAQSWMNMGLSSNYKDSVYEDRSPILSRNNNPTSRHHRPRPHFKNRIFGSSARTATSTIKNTATASHISVKNNPPVTIIRSSSHNRQKETNRANGTPRVRRPKGIMTRNNIGSVATQQSRASSHSTNTVATAAVGGTFSFFLPSRTNKTSASTTATRTGRLCRMYHGRSGSNATIYTPPQLLRRGSQLPITGVVSPRRSNGPFNRTCCSRTAKVGTSTGTGTRRGSGTNTGARTSTRTSKRTGRGGRIQNIGCTGTFTSTTSTCTGSTCAIDTKTPPRSQAKSTTCSQTTHTNRETPHSASRIYTDLARTGRNIGKSTGSHNRTVHVPVRNNGTNRSRSRQCPDSKKMSKGNDNNNDNDGASIFWKEAVDPKSGRTYFYNVNTRETQWRKPLEMASAEERESMESKERKQREFFAAMEANILNATAAVTNAKAPIAAPAAATVIPATVLSKEAYVSKSSKSIKRPNMVRTISTMDESVLKGLTRFPSAIKLNVDSNPGENTKRSSSVVSIPIATAIHASNDNDDDNDGNRTSLTLGELEPRGNVDVMDTLQEYGEASTNSFNPNFSVLSPEISDRQPKQQQQQQQQPLIVREENEIFEHEEEELTIVEIHQLEELGRVMKEMIVTTPASAKSSYYHNSSIHLDLQTASDESFSDHLNFEESTSSDHLIFEASSSSLNFEESSLSKSSLNFEESSLYKSNLESDPGARSGSGSKANSKTSAPSSKAQKLQKPRMAKRNTCGTMYLANTMSAPDKDANIKCVCGVYRAHILHTSKEEETATNLPLENADKYLLFNDFPEHRTLLSPTKNISSIKQNVPTHEEISRFYRDVFSKSQMETDCIIMSLIYVERLIKVTNGGLRPGVKNWRSMLMSCMVLSSKVWDDLSMWNADFANVVPSGMKFSLVRLNELEIAVLNCLTYNVKVLSSEYAKYYFLLRSMLIKSGLSGDGDMLSSINSKALDVEGAKKLEQLSSNFKVSFKKTRGLPRKTKSLGTNQMTSTLEEAGIGIGTSTSGKVSLERLVNMSSLK